jgi:peptidoglycan/LPS O-acetylase OafA/YrhL
MAQPKRPLSFYRPELDFVRFVAFLLVFSHHVFQRQASSYVKYFHSQLSCQTIASAVDACGFGLPLFFALSGYLIGELLRLEKERTGEINIRAFYRRRMLRILPLYFLGLTIGLVIAAINAHLRRDVFRLLSDVLMIGNLYVIRNGWNSNPMGHLWSISIEGQFYIYWPWIARRGGKVATFGACIAMIALANIALFQLGRSHANLDYAVWANSFVQFYMFAAGILVALTLKGKLPNQKTVWRFAGLALVMLCWQIASQVFQIKTFAEAKSPGALMAGYTLVAIGCGLLIFSLLGTPGERFPSAVLYLGRISYGLYVYHFLALGAAEWLVARFFVFPHHNAFGTGLGLLLTVLFAALSYKYFEKPFLVAKRKSEIVYTVPEEANASWMVRTGRRVDKSTPQPGHSNQGFNA